MSEEASLLSGTRCVVSTLYMQHACTVDYILQQMQRRSQWRGKLRRVDSLLPCISRACQLTFRQASQCASNASHDYKIAAQC